jgi:hypothetical protein
MRTLLNHQGAMQEKRPSRVGPEGKQLISQGDLGGVEVVSIFHHCVRTQIVLAQRLKDHEIRHGAGPREA